MCKLLFSLNGRMAWSRAGRPFGTDQRSGGAMFSRGLFMLLLLLNVLGGVSCSCRTKGADPATIALLGRVRADLKPLRSEPPVALSASQRAYLDFYGVQTRHLVHQMGTFESRGVALAGHLIKASGKAKGTVILVHGYFDHAGYFNHLINRLGTEGYNVAVYDHPGHGLSEGRRISTKDFAIYRDGFADFVDLVTEYLPGPYDVIAHSMGATAVIDRLLLDGQDPLRRLVLITPLIRDATPRILLFVGYALSAAVDYFPRVAEDNSSDPDYLARVKTDPLQFRCVSTHWSRAFLRWRKRIENCQPRAERPLILTAEIDTVIDNEYGHRWMRGTFPGGRFETIPGGRHHLLNDARPIRERVMGMILAELER